MDNMKIGQFHQLESSSLGCMCKPHSGLSVNCYGPYYHPSVNVGERPFKSFSSGHYWNTSGISDGAHVYGSYRPATVWSCCHGCSSINSGTVISCGLTGGFEQSGDLNCQGNQKSACVGTWNPHNVSDQNPMMGGNGMYPRAGFVCARSNNDEKYCLASGNFPEVAHVNMMRGCGNIHGCRPVFYRQQCTSHDPKPMMVGNGVYPRTGFGCVRCYKDDEKYCLACGNFPETTHVNMMRGCGNVHGCQPIFYRQQWTSSDPNPMMVGNGMYPQIGFGCARSYKEMSTSHGCQPVFHGQQCASRVGTCGFQGDQHEPWQTSNHFCRDCSMKATE